MGHAEQFEAHFEGGCRESVAITELFKPDESTRNQSGLVKTVNCTCA